jgi:hypothetical protein
MVGDFNRNDIGCRTHERCRNRRHVMCKSGRDISRSSNRSYDGITGQLRCVSSETRFQTEFGEALVFEAKLMWLCDLGPVALQKDSLYLRILSYVK